MNQNFKITFITQYTFDLSFKAICENYLFIITMCFSLLSLMCGNSYRILLS